MDWDEIVKRQGDQTEDDYNGSRTKGRKLNQNEVTNEILYMVRHFTIFCISIYFMRISYKLTAQLKPKGPNHKRL